MEHYSFKGKNILNDIIYDKKSDDFGNIINRFIFHVFAINLLINNIIFRMKNLVSHIFKTLDGIKTIVESESGIKKF